MKINIKLISQRLLALLVVFAALGVEARAAHIYVKAGGGESAPYDSWGNAFTNLQDAFDYVMANASDGANIYLAGETFEGIALGATHPSNSVFLLQAVSNIVIRGGYEAESGSGDNPGTPDPDQWPTVLRRSSGNARVLYLSGVSNAVIEQVTIRDGSGVANAGGVHLSNCKDIVIDTCRIVNNQANSGNGGGIYLAASTVMLTNSLIVSNSIPGTSGGRGGGAYLASGSQLTVIRSMISENYVESGSRHSTGSRGGGFTVASGNTLDIRESVLKRNRAIATGDGSCTGGAIENLGTLYLRNTLLIDNWSHGLTFSGGGKRPVAENGDGLYMTGAGAQTIIVNCTIVANNHSGFYREGAGGTIAITNSIFWGHTTVDAWNMPESGGVYPIWYSNLEQGLNDGIQGCSSHNPLFVDTTHYHLKSTGGFYTNGYFDGGILGGGYWTTAAVNSPLIDRGDPAADWSREPEPNGGRINMGAYGGTEVAAKTPPPPEFPPMVDNPGALKWGYHTAVLYGEVIEDYGELPDTWFHYWKAGDPAVTNSIYGGTRVGEFSATLSGLTPDETYWYVVAASNRAGETVSFPSVFVTRPPDVPLYVASAGDNTAGTNWATAYHDPHTAWRIAQTGDTLLFAGETFEGEPDLLHGKHYAFIWQNATNMTLRGGWRASVAEGDDENLPGARDSDLWPTVLQRRDDSGNGRALTISGISNAVIEQITFRNGHGVTDGGGVYLTGCRDIVFDTCRIVENLGASGNGGGLYMINSTVTLTNCLVAGNSVTGSGFNGGGIHVAAGSHLTVLRSIAYNNLAQCGWRHGADANGGGLYVASGATADVRDAKLIRNRAYTTSNGSTYGGAIDNRGTLYLRNSLVVSNWSHQVTTYSGKEERGDGIFSAGNTIIVNCTIADNNQSGRHRVGLDYAGGTLAVTNTIVWGHLTLDIANVPTNAAGAFNNFSHSLYGTAQTGGEPVDMHEISGCIVGVDPLFEGIGEHPYRLQRYSEAIDAGINLPWMTGATDLAGNPRIMGRLQKVDMGAYETLPPPGSMFMFR